MTDFTEIEAMFIWQALEKLKAELKAKGLILKQHEIRVSGNGAFVVILSKREAL